MLTNHSARLVLDGTTPNFNWANDCNDLTVVDASGNALPHFLQHCDTSSQHAVLWVQVPTIPASPAKVELELRYNDASATSQSNALATFQDRGYLYHTQPYTDAVPGPESRIAGDAIFNYDSVTSASGYGCTQLKNAGVDNSGVFGSNIEIAYRVQTILNVGVSGNFEFRYGSDFGHGGEIAINGVALAADWTTDLWWGLNYANPDVLQDSTFLAAGDHTMDMLGFELCCDGRTGLQYRKLPAGSWTNLDVANSDMTLLAPDCPYDRSKLLIDDHQTAVDLVLSKTVSRSAPSIGDVVTFKVKVENKGPFTATNVNVTDNVPAGFNMLQNISHGGTASGNTITWIIPSLAAGGSLDLTFDATVL